MKKLLENFKNAEDGAVTVDFVVLTAAICLLGAICVNAFAAEPVRMANNMSNFMEQQCSDGTCD
ncbi:hypothetical protein BC777_1630 [Yoonia maricola]|uniref:Flp pilus assembly pilin Flp n=1 Tax=Yoonia maricola TaxID=420999 RepID=A0A2M8WPA5_9RHOB|nr:hypothetical protein [Yoonia maricola]PJI92769.1 hypothetical protein BC777_1630 [Yoonia maricola]